MPLSALRPSGPRRRRGRRWRPSLQTYLLGLLAIFTLLAGTAVWEERRQNLERAEGAATELAELQASIAANLISGAIELTQASVAELAANPSLPQLLTTKLPSGCSLTFTGAGPFARGHIDVIDQAGTVVCSSEPLPEPGRYAAEPWLPTATSEPSVVGPIDDPSSGRRALVVSAPVGGDGLVATFLDVDAVDATLAENLGGSQHVRFVLDDGTDPATPPPDSIVASANIDALGWTLHAAVPRTDALAAAQADNEQLLRWLAGGLVTLFAATYLLHVALARPIRRLRAAVRTATGTDIDVPIPTSGPVEVAGLAADFATLRDDVAQELARRQQAERDAEASLESYRRIFTANPLPMWVFDTETFAFLEVNDAAIAHYGYSRDEFLAMTIRDIRPAEDEPELVDHVAHAPPLDRSGPWRHLRKDGSVIDVEVTSHAIDFGGQRGRFVMAEDITQRERTRRLLERAERMESLGQLAGGVAHDFNNILAVILNYADFVTDELTPAAATDPQRWQPVLRDAEQITAAGRRAAELTHQLLAFARGETPKTQALDLNQVARETEDMLRRTIGEQVDLHLSLEPELWPITANAGHLVQVLVNLAVNARDAMPTGGRLLIETSNVHVDDEQLTTRPELTAGRYVRLRVSDTGIGMDAATREHVFEPMFTTKERGRGTGLGLATVYGIVTRAGGFLNVYSEPGLGTTISALLPAAETAPETHAAEPELATSLHAATILLAEDDDQVRAVTERILANAGFTVLSAASGTEALALADTHPGGIDLLLTDVVMPEMLGADLAVQLHGADPGVRVLFMSGYAPPLLLAGGRLPLDAPLIDKPFAASALLAQVHAVLDGSAPGSRPPVVQDPPTDHGGSS